MANRDIVVIGGSAGTVEAVGGLLAELGPELDPAEQRAARDALIRRHALAPALGFLA